MTLPPYLSAYRASCTCKRAFTPTWWISSAAWLVFKRAIHKGAAREDLTAIVKHIERDAGFEMPKTR